MRVKSERGRKHAWRMPRGEVHVDSEQNRAKFYSDVYWEEENDIRWLSIVNSAVLASVLVITVLFMMHRIRSVDRTVEDEEEGSFPHHAHVPSLEGVSVVPLKCFSVVSL